jgi:hypothetical protein
MEHKRDFSSHQMCTPDHISLEKFVGDFSFVDLHMIRVTTDGCNDAKRAKRPCFWDTLLYINSTTVILPERADIQYTMELGFVHLQHTLQGRAKP